MLAPSAPMLAQRTANRQQLNELEVGARVGAYLIEAVRARLPHVVVYRAEHVFTGRTVALHVLRPSREAPPVAELRRELAALNRLRHAHVAELLEHGELDDGRPYLVVEWVAGRSLQTLLDQRRVLGFDEMLLVVDEIASALAAAHALGVTHGELHARNVGLVAHGEHHLVKLVNFGMARLSGTRLAPEQAQNRALDAGDVRADVYALGALLYQMVTGMRPTADPSPPSLYAEVPRGFDEVVLRALRSEPSRRWPSVEALMEDLRACASGSELVAELHVSAFIDPEVELLELAALDDVEAALQLAQTWLEQQNVALVLGGAGAVIATARIPRAIDAQRAARAGWVKLANAVQTRVEQRPNKHPAVRVRAHIRIDG